MADAAHIPFGLRVEDGRMVSVSEVPQGALCGCVCAACRRPLIAAKGEQRADYFRHASHACAHGAETAIHAAAKQIIRDVRAMQVRPREVVAVGVSQSGKVIRETAVVDPSTALTFDSVDLERPFQEGVVADVAATAFGTTYLIEVWVRHAVDEPKLQKLKRMNLPALQVDLHDVAFCSYEKLVQMVTRCADRTQWLHTPGQERAWAEAHAALTQKLDEENVVFRAAQAAEKRAKSEAKADALWQKLSDEREERTRKNIRRRAARVEEPAQPSTGTVKRYTGPTLLWANSGDKELLQRLSFMLLPSEAIAELSHSVERRYQCEALEPEALIALTATRWRVDQAVIRDALVDSGFVVVIHAQQE